MLLVAPHGSDNSQTLRQLDGSSSIRRGSAVDWQCRLFPKAHSTAAGLGFRVYGSENHERLSEDLEKLGVPNELTAPAVDEATANELREALGAVTLDENLRVPANVKRALVDKGFRYVAGTRC